MEFKNPTDAKRKTGLSYLGSVNSSAKISKGKKYNVETYILYLAPANRSGYEVCPMRSPECTEACLNESGRNKIDIHKNRINKARVKKTKLFFEEKEFFMNWLVTEIERSKKKADKKGKEFSVRFNGTSDIDLSKLNLDGKNILDIFPDVQFYDYTKVFPRMRKYNDTPNYDLTYSYSGHNMEETMEVLTDSIGRVAVVFEGPELPKTWKGFEVIDGDTYDMRYVDPKGVVVGLRFKKVRNEIDTSGSPFIISNDNPDCEYE